jgi:hypothetical protein
LAQNHIEAGTPFMQLSKRLYIFTFVVTSLAVAITTATAHSQEDYLVKPTEEHELLKKDVGNWNAVVKVWPMEGTEPIENKGVEKNELLKGGLWLISRFEGEAAGMPFVGAGTTGYDPVEKKYIGTWVDSMSPHIMISKSEYDADKKIMTGTAEGRDGMTGKPFSAKVTSRYEDDDTRVFEMQMPGDDGKYWKMLEIRYTRSGD